jgi:hypothetical protein
MNNFKTTNGITYTINIKTKDVKAVKDLIKYADGRAVDIFEAAETGTLGLIYKDIEVLINVIFVLCLDQVKDVFDLSKYDENNKKTYELMPELANEPPLTKASRWFGSTVDGNVIIEMIEAFSEAIINFIPNQSRRIALRTVLEREKEVEQIEADYRQQTANLLFEKTKAQLATRWAKLTDNKMEQINQILDGQFD